MNHNQRIGKWGEEIAAGYLLEQGFDIVARNARTPYGEIDIVARQGDITIFIEVKTRTSDKMGMPEDSITARKRQHKRHDVRPNVVVVNLALVGDDDRTVDQLRIVVPRWWCGRWRLNPA